MTRHIPAFGVAILVSAILLSTAGADESPESEAVWDSPATIRVAAVQLESELGEVNRNLDRSERLVVEAFDKGADWVVLPEMFTSAMAVHPKMLDAIRPARGEPYEFLVRLAREHSGVVGGSFLAFRDGNAYNTFVLAFPDGSTFFHDKDEPTLWENRYYTRGKDAGVLDTPAGPVGSALCAEMLRTGTARRLQERVGIVLAGSCWWTVPDGSRGTERIDSWNREVLRAAPQNVARALGVPVVHASHVGSFESLNPKDESQPYTSRYLGETQIVDGRGNVLARLGPGDGEGVILAEVEAGTMWSPRDALPAGTWMSRIPRTILVRWVVEAARGGRQYRSTTLPYLKRVFATRDP